MNTGKREKKMSAQGCHCQLCKGMLRDVTISHWMVEKKNLLRGVTVNHRMQEKREYSGVVTISHWMVAGKKLLRGVTVNHRMHGKGISLGCH